MATASAEAASVPISRIGAHSHIRGLGLSDDLSPESREGLVGQVSARKAAGIVQRLVSQNRLSGRALLISGRPGSGKTALAHALSLSLGPNFPFTKISASELFSLEMSATEALTEAIRRSISVEIPEETDIIEGEVALIRIEDSAQGTGERMGKIVLKTTDMESSFDVGPKMVEMLNKEAVELGDVISIDKTTGRVSKLGRVMATAADFDVLGQNAKLLPPPTGELLKRRQVDHVVTLHDMDVINSRSEGFLALFSGETGEISAEVRDEVDQRIAAWKEEGRAVVTSGVLFIDECHILNLEAFSFLNRVLESEIAPLVVFATNRGRTKIRGTDYISPFGMPADLLDRLLIISTEPLSEDELCGILQRRADEEDVEAEPGAIQFLGRLAGETSLRYAIELLAASRLVAEKRGQKVLGCEHVREAYELFYDIKRSVDMLERYGDAFMFNMVAGGYNSSKNAVVTDTVGVTAAIDAPRIDQEDTKTRRRGRAAKIDDDE